MYPKCKINLHSYMQEGTCTMCKDWLEAYNYDIVHGSVSTCYTEGLTTVLCDKLTHLSASPVYSQDKKTY